MVVRQLWTGNSYRNFNYLLACTETGEALAIDPLDFRMCLEAAAANNWQITQIVNTHHHGDHIGGNNALVAATGATLIAHRDATNLIPNIDKGLGAGDKIEIGSSVRLNCLDTPGHTMSHLCLLENSATPALFTGDTLFNAGAGNCHNGGHPEALYQTFVETLAGLPDETRVFPGHDYLENNLRFTLDREPQNQAAAALLARVTPHDPTNAYVTTLGEERRVNVFLRLTEAGVKSGVAPLLESTQTAEDPKAVFLKLRELRNDW